MKSTICLLIISLFLSTTSSFDDIAIKGGTIINIADGESRCIKNHTIYHCESLLP